MVIACGSVSRICCSDTTLSQAQNKYIDIIIAPPGRQAGRQADRQHEMTWLFLFAKLLPGGL